MGIQIWALRWQTHRLYISIAQDRSERRAEVGIATHQDILLSVQESVERVREVPGDLLHELVAQCRRASGKVNTTSGDFHDK